MAVRRNNFHTMCIQKYKLLRALLPKKDVQSQARQDKKFLFLNNRLKCEKKRGNKNR